MKGAWLAAILLGVSATVVYGQAPGGEHGGHGGEGDAMAGMPGMAAMEGTADPVRPHIRLSPARVGVHEDTLRAEEVVRRLRTAIAKYADTAAAVADGYVFRPRFKRPPKVYHFTNRRNALMSAMTFDPERPTSILYERQPGGTLKLVGAMYTAPRWSSLDDLDHRLPLSVARWHRHANLCWPRRGDEARLAERDGGRPVFGPASPIATAEACEAVGGRFTGENVPWMVHVNVFAGDDLATIFAHGH